MSRQRLVDSQPNSTSSTGRTRLLQIYLPEGDYLRLKAVAPPGKMGHLVRALISQLLQKIPEPDKSLTDLLAESSTKEPSE